MRLNWCGYFGYCLKENAQMTSSQKAKILWNDVMVVRKREKAQGVKGHPAQISCPRIFVPETSQIMKHTK
jgi:hypothetical protein